MYFQLHVFCGNNGIPTELSVAVRNYVEEMAVELKWTDLYNETSDVPSNMECQKDWRNPKLIKSIRSLTLLHSLSASIVRSLQCTPLSK